MRMKSVFGILIDKKKYVYHKSKYHMDVKLEFLIKPIMLSLCTLFSKVLLPWATGLSSQALIFYMSNVAFSQLLNHSSTTRKVGNGCFIRYSLRAKWGCKKCVHLFHSASFFQKEVWKFTWCHAHLMLAYACTFNFVGVLCYIEKHIQIINLNMWKWLSFPTV